MNIYGEMIYNGYTFKDLQMVTVGSGDDGNIFGINRDIETEETNNIPLFNKFNNKVPTLTFDLMKIDKNRNPISMTKDEKYELQRRLFSENSYGRLQSKEKSGIVYYGAFVGDIKEHFIGGVSYISLNFQLASSCCYSNIMVDFYNVENSKIIEIMNRSNVSKTMNIDIEFEMIDGNDIEFINLTSGKSVFVRNMEDKEHVYIYGDVKEYISKIDENRNILRLSSRNVMDLMYGKNRIKIITKKAKVRFVYQYELGID